MLPSAGAKDRTQCCEGQFAWEEWSCRAAGSQGCQATHHQSKQSCNALLHGGVGIFFFFFPWTQCIHYVSPEKIERAGRYLCLTAKKSLCVGPALKHLFGLVWMEEQSQAVVSAHTLRPSQVLKVALVAWEQGCHCPASPSASAPSLNITSASPVLIPGHAAVVGKPCWIPSLLNNGRRL